VSVEGGLLLFVFCCRGGTLLAKLVELTSPRLIVVVVSTTSWRGGIGGGSTGCDGCDRESEQHLEQRHKSNSSYR
jgi:hypothetical protein